jgi:hypothetical protein
MKQDKLLERQHAMLSCLAGVPRRILSLQDVHNLPEFVLHDLCQERCFNLNKAAFFVDNPGFNCTKGVAGFSRCELPQNSETILNDPQAFSEHMKASAFNQKVRPLSHCSLNSLANSHEEAAQRLASDLGLENYAHCSWGMKHENHGFVLYEKADAHDTFADDYMLNGLSLLSFCPIF